MSTTFNLSGLGFASITVGVTTTTMPLLGISYSPNLGREPFRSGGDLSPSMMRRAGARPAFRLTLPMDIAWTILGQFLPVNLAAFAMYEPLFTGTPALRVGTGATTVSQRATTGIGIALITRIYPSGGQVPMMLADALIVMGSTDGITDPISVSTGTLPALGSNPTIHTMGPLVDNATARWGVKSWSIDTGIGLEAIQSDGLFYPTGYRIGALQPVYTITHNDVKALYAAMGELGEDSTGAGFILWARAYDAAAKTLQTTGYSFTMAKGMASIESFGAQGTDREEMALQIAAYAAPGTLTYPIAVATGATLPT